MNEAENSVTSGTRLSWRQAARRSDALLRSEFPHLQTRIFELSIGKYCIVVPAADAAQIADIEQVLPQIIPAHLSVTLDSKMPSLFDQEIDPISDAELAQKFAGITLSVSGYRDIIRGVLHTLPPLIDISNQGENIHLSFSVELSDAEQTEVRDFIDGIEPGFQVSFSVAPSASARTASSSPASLEEFIKADRTFWFDHVDKVYSGQLTPRSIFDNEKAGYACYIDATSFEQIDLRQAVLCYDTVWISPPLTGENVNFFSRSGLSESDVLKLIAEDRVRLILRQPEARANYSFVAAAYERNPSAIIGRMRAAALFAADVVQTDDEYRFSSVAPEVLRSLVRDVAPQLGCTERELAQLMLWPKLARRASLQHLMDAGLQSLMSFGQERLLADQLKRLSGKDVLLEASAYCDSVHIAHMLNATLIPSIETSDGWNECTRMIGGRLNFYRSFNGRIAASWAANARRQEERIRLLPNLPVFDFERHAPIEDLLAFTSQASTRRKGRALLSRLALLEREEQATEIENLTRELYERGVKKARRQMAVDLADDAVSIGTAIAEVSLLPVRNIVSLLGTVLSVGRKKPEFDALADVLEGDLKPKMFKNEDLDFLSKIERVAQFRRVDG